MIRSIVYDPRPQDELCWAVVVQQATTGTRIPVLDVESRHGAIDLAERAVLAAQAPAAAPLRAGVH